MEQEGLSREEADSIQEPLDHPEMCKGVLHAPDMSKGDRHAPELLPGPACPQGELPDVLVNLAPAPLDHPDVPVNLSPAPRRKQTPAGGRTERSRSKTQFGRSWRSLVTWES